MLVIEPDSLGGWAAVLCCPAGHLIGTVAGQLDPGPETQQPTT
jgi:hypothetical protein